MDSQILDQPHSSPFHLHKNPTILVVEDEKSIADFLCTCLEKQGYQSLQAATGKDALRIAHSEHPDLVLLDLHLPDMEGFVVGEELADSPDTCGIPVIVLSAMERPDIVRRTRASGCRYYLRKPYDPNALLVLIQHTLVEEA